MEKYRSCQTKEHIAKTAMNPMSWMAAPAAAADGDRVPWTEEEEDFDLFSTSRWCAFMFFVVVWHVCSALLSLTHYYRLVAVPQTLVASHVHPDGSEDRYPTPRAGQQGMTSLDRRTRKLSEDSAAKHFVRQANSHVSSGKVEAMHCWVREA
jgi:hypothetical protein